MTLAVMAYLVLGLGVFGQLAASQDTPTPTWLMVLAALVWPVALALTAVGFVIWLTTEGRRGWTRR